MLARICNSCLSPKAEKVGDKNKDVGVNLCFFLIKGKFVKRVFCFQQKGTDCKSAPTGGDSSSW